MLYLDMSDTRLRSIVRKLLLYLFLGQGIRQEAGVTVFRVETLGMLEKNWVRLGLTLTILWY